MKYIGLIILFCLLSFRVNAQNEVPADSVRSMNMPATKNFDGFLLDMNLMKMAAPQMPKMTLDIPDASKDYSFLFRLDPNVTYSQGYSHLFSLGSSTIYSMNPFRLTDSFRIISPKPANGKFPVEEWNAHQYLWRV